MSADKPYKHCRQCGNRFSNDKLSEHAAQCKMNDSQKVYDSFDFNQKKQITTQTVEDNDRVKEMKETIQPSEEKQINETSGYQEECLKDSGPSQTRETKKKSSKSTSLGNKKGAQASSPSSKGIDPITGKKKSHQTNGKGHQDNKPFPSYRKEGTSPIQETGQRSSSSDNEKSDNISTSEKTDFETDHTNDEENQDNKPFPRPREEGTSPIQETGQKSSSSDNEKTDNISTSKKTYSRMDHTNDEEHQDNKPFSNPREGGTSSTQETGLRLYSSDSEKNGNISTSRKTHSKFRDANDEEHQDNKPFPNPREGAASSQTQETRQNSSSSDNNKSGKVSRSKKNYSKTERKKSHEANDDEDQDNKLFSKSSKDGEPSKIQKSKRRSSSREVTKRLNTQKSSSCSKQFNPKTGRRKSRQERDEKHQGRQNSDSKKSGKVSSSRSEKKSDKTNDDENQDNKQFENSSKDDGFSKTHESRRRPSSSEVTKRLYTQKSSSCSKQFNPRTGRRKSRQETDEEHKDSNPSSNPDSSDNSSQDNQDSKTTGKSFDRAKREEL